MVRILDEKMAKNIWDDNILQLSNPTYYQSYDYSRTYMEDEEINFLYDNDGGKKIYAFAKLKKGFVTIPFGPIVSSNVTVEDIMKFITEVSQIYQQDVMFSISDDQIEDFNNRFGDIQKDWYFVTPLIDTTLSMEEILHNCNENRRRIIKKGLVNIPRENIRFGIEYIDDFYKLYNKRMSETGGRVDFSLDYLEHNLSEKNSDLVVCLDKGKVIAGHVIYRFGNTLITRYNCFDSDYSKISPSARIDYELINYACSNSNIDYYDMSGLATGEEITEKTSNINRYKQSYGPTKILRYQWYRYKK